MAYTRNLAKSARRHLAAANSLYDDTKPQTAQGNKAVAGYLFGLAGELALKQIMLKMGMKEPQESEKRGHPMYAHFPELKTRLRDIISGRRSAELRKYTESQWFREWDVEMRYAPTTEIHEGWTTLWKSQAEELVAEMDR
jgi:hypothetical protein